MEYFELGDLQKYLSSSAPLPEVETQEIIFQILEASPLCMKMSLLIEI
jgi:serine/threonine protein kinase